MATGLNALRQAYASNNEEPMPVLKGKAAKQAPAKNTKAVEKLLINSGIKKGSKAFEILKGSSNTSNLMRKFRTYQNFLKTRGKNKNLSGLVLLISRRSNVSGLTLSQTLNFLMNTRRNLNNYDTLAKKLLNANTGRTLFPQAFNASASANTKLRAKAQWAELQDAARHWGTGSWQASRSGGVLETIAVATAAAGSGVKVVYWGDPKDFPGSEIEGITFRFDQDPATLLKHIKSSPNRKVLFLKARISLDKLKTMENNLKRQEAWLEAIKANSTKASLNALKKTATYKNLMALKGKSANNSSWKGYYYVEPDGILLEMDAQGRLTISVLEFKITTGKAESVPAEAYQLAKARRSLLFAFPDATINNYFVAWQFGTSGNSTNFYDPYELANGTSAPNRPNANYIKQNVWSKAFRTKLKKDYFVEKLGPVRFQTVTGINSATVEHILREIRRLDVTNIASKMASTVRHLPPGNVRQALEPGGHVRNKELLKRLNNLAASGGAGPSNCRSKYTNEPARRIGCNKLTNGTMTNIVRAIRFAEPWINKSKATNKQRAAINRALRQMIPNKLETNDPRYASQQKYFQRIKAWTNRLNKPSEWAEINASNNSRALFLKNLKGYKPEAKSNKNTIILRVMQNASLMNPSIVPQLVNVLKETGANKQTWASIFNSSINRKNIQGALIRKAGANRGLGPAGNAYAEEKM